MRKLTYKEVKEYIEGSEGNGCKLLSKEYINGKTKLEIQCKCGEIFEVIFENFKGGNKKQCNKCGKKLKSKKNKGRIRSEQHKKHLSEAKKGKCTKENNPMFGKHHTKEAKKKMREAKKEYIPWNKGIKLPQFSGENSPRWDSSITDEERKNRRNIERYADWRKSVYERDNYTCQCCGDNKGGNLNAHHLDSYNLDKDHRTDTNNGITLCDK